MTESPKPFITHRDLPAGTVTFLFSDIVGSTQLWERHPETMHGLLAEHDAILRGAVKNNNGLVIKGRGDGVHAVFEAAVDAVNTTIEAQRQLFRLENEGRKASGNPAEDDPDAITLRVRMGLHTGEAEVRDGDYFGQAPNRAARVMSAGHGGQILMSEITANVVREHLPAGTNLLDLGELHLKGMERPERLFQVTAPDLKTDFPPLAARRPAAHNLPTNLTRFVGRERETDQVRELLKEHPLVTIIGPGGLGKTRLALHTAWHEINSHKDGVFFVALDSIYSPNELVSAIASALQFPLAGQQDPLEQLINYTCSREMLLVLDNFEHILDGSDALTPLLAGSPGLKLLVTSREALRLMEEWRFQLKGLSYPDPSAIKSGIASGDNENWADTEAVQLFIDRARQARADFSPDDEMESILRICQLVEGSPLAIELAAAWVRSLSPAEIILEIENSLNILSTSMRNLPDRHRSIQAIFNQTWENLSPREQDVFMRLSVFQGGFERAAAREIVGASVLDLSNLVDKSLLRREDDRYQIHRLLRSYAKEILDTHVDAALETTDEHCRYFASFLKERYSYIQSQDKLHMLREIDAEIDNIRKAWGWAVERVLLTELKSILISLGFYYQLRSGFLEWWQMMLTVEPAINALPKSTQRDAILADLYVEMSWMAIRLGKFDQGEAQVNHSLEILAALEIPPSRGMGMDPKVPRAALYNIRGDYHNALMTGQRGLQACIERGDRENQPFFYFFLASTASALGEFSNAGSFAQRGIDLCRELENDWFMAYCVNELGVVERALGHYESAKKLFLESLAIREAFQDPEGQALALNHLGSIALQQRNFEAAIDIFQRSRALYRDIGDLGGQTATMAGLGEAYLGLMEPMAACEHLIKALSISVEIEFIPSLVAVLTSAGQLLIEIGHVQEGLSALELVLRHPGSSSEIKSQAEKHYQDSQSSLSPDERQAISRQAQQEILPASKAVLEILKKAHADQISNSQVV